MLNHFLAPMLSTCKQEKTNPESCCIKHHLIKTNSKESVFVGIEETNKLVPLWVNKQFNSHKKQKYDNIISLLQWVDEKNQYYYQNLPSTADK